MAYRNWNPKSSGWVSSRLYLIRMTYGLCSVSSWWHMMLPYVTRMARRNLSKLSGWGNNFQFFVTRGELIHPAFRSVVFVSYVESIMQKRRNSSALAKELPDFALIHWCILAVRPRITLYAPTSFKHIDKPLGELYIEVIYFDGIIGQYAPMWFIT